MGSTFSGIEIGKKSLLAHQTGLQVVGHNLANKDNESFSRQKINPVSFHPLYEPSLNRAERAGQIGQGVEIQDIRRVRDIYLDERIYTEGGNKEYWSKRNELLTQIEQVQNALGDVNLREKLDLFWQRWQDLSVYPAERAVRETVLESANELSDAFNTTFERFNRMRHEVNEKVIDNVLKINTIADNIGKLNIRINNSLAAGDNPNDLQDRRDALIEDLSKLANIRVNFRDRDEPMVYIGERTLVQGGVVNKITTQDNPQNEGMVDVYWETDNAALKLKAGSLKSLVDIRDGSLNRQIQALDSLALNVMVSVNDIHSQGFNNYKRTGIEFFEYNTLGTNPLGNYDANEDTIADSTYMFQLKGGNILNEDDIIGESGTLTIADRNGNNININYTSDEKVKDLIKRINQSDTSVNALVDKDGYLVIKAKNSNDYEPFAIRHLEDSGNFLTGIANLLNASGPNGSYDAKNIDQYTQLSTEADFKLTPHHHPSSWMKVNRYVNEDSNHIAASDGVEYNGDKIKDKSNGQGDGSIAQQIANIRTRNIMVENSETIDDFYKGEIAFLAEQNFQAMEKTEDYSAILKNIHDTRQSISGVNIDEEMTYMISLQHGYQAAAKVVAMMDKMLDVLINIT